MYQPMQSKAETALAEGRFLAASYDRG